MGNVLKLVVNNEPTKHEEYLETVADLEEDINELKYDIEKADGTIEDLEDEIRDHETDKDRLEADKEDILQTLEKVEELYLEMRNANIHSWTDFQDQMDELLEVAK